MEAISEALTNLKAHPKVQLFLDNPVAIIAPGFFFLVLLAIFFS
ncbi:hypothetical protein SmphiM6_104 [Sinorhizobium phage phiM6]|nr:hypothetical protein SmphiM6_104 [Sinorhizobium phage phiM6]